MLSLQNGTLQQLISTTLNFVSLFLLPSENSATKFNFKHRQKIIYLKFRFNRQALSYLGLITVVTVRNRYSESSFAGFLACRKLSVLLKYQLYFFICSTFVVRI